MKNALRPRPRFDRRDERVVPSLGLSEKQAIRVVEALRRSGAGGPSEHRPAPNLPCPRQDVVRRGLLYEHAARKHHVCPAQIVSL